MKTHDMPHTACTECGKEFDAATNAGPYTVSPKPGDYSICIHCGHVMIFNGDMTVRDPTVMEMYEIAENKEVMAAVEAVCRIHEKPDA